MRWSRRTIDALFADMRAEAEAVVRLGVPQGELVETRTGFMRYRGQGHEVAVPLPERRARPAPRCVRRSMRPMHASIGRVIPRLEVEAVTWTLSLAEPHDLPTPAAGAAGCRCRDAGGTLPRRRDRQRRGRRRRAVRAQRIGARRSA